MNNEEPQCFSPPFPVLRLIASLNAVYKSVVVVVGDSASQTALKDSEREARG